MGSIFSILYCPPACQELYPSTDSGVIHSIAMSRPKTKANEQNAYKLVNN